MCRSRVLSHLPFIHLLPNPLYKALLKLGHESDGAVRGLLDTKETKCPIEVFERIAKEDFSIVNRTLWFINPHYEIKFGLTPKKLCGFVGRIPYIRNFFTTSSFYILKAKQDCTGAG